MKFFCFLLFLGWAFSAEAQKIQLLDQYRRPTEDSSKAVFFSKTIKSPTSEEGIIRTYYLDGIKVAEEQFSNLEKRIRSGTNRAWFENGQLKHEISYLNNTFHGPLL